MRAKYHDAYEVVIEVKRERPDWGATRIANEVRRRTGIPVPRMTAYFWIKGKSRPSITPLRVCRELGYAVGALMTDSTKDDEVKLAVRDLDFALAFREALRAVTGREYRIKWNREEGRWIVRLGGSPLRYIARSGL